MRRLRELALAKRHVGIGLDRVSVDGITLACQVGADRAPHRDANAESSVREFLAGRGPEVATAAGDVQPPDLREQCEAFLELKPTAVSSIMGLYPPEYVARLKQNGIAWFATVTTLASAITTPGTQSVTVADPIPFGNGAVLVIDTTTMRQIGTFAVGSMPALAIVAP